MNLEKLGAMIKGLREKRGLSQEELCMGLCGKRELSRIELGERIPDVFFLDRILSRMGRSIDKLEFILSEEEYRFYELRAELEDALEQENRRLAEELLEAYAERLGKKDVLHWQYVEMVRALLCWDSQEKEAAVWLKRAMERTLHSRKKESFWSMAMGREELLLLLLWCEKGIQGAERLFLNRKILEYLEGQWQDIEEKGKIYPYAATLLAEELIKEEGFEEAERLCEETIEVLTAVDSICYLQKTLTLLIQAKRALGKGEEAEELMAGYEALTSLFEEYGSVDKSRFIVMRLKKQFYIDREIIRKNRMSRRMTQEQLSEGICEPETLSRIEGGRKAHKRNFLKLSQRLGWNKEIRSTELAIWDFEKLEEKGKIDALIGYRRYEEAKEYLKSFSCEETPESRQYLLYMLTMVRVQLGELTYQEALGSFEEALSFTLKNYKEISFKDYVLTRLEMLILNGIALVHIKSGEKEKGVQIYKDVLEGCEKSRVKEQFQTIAVLVFMENLPVYLEELGQYEEALGWHEKTIRLVLKCKRGLLLDKVLTNKAHVWEHQGRSKEDFLRLYKQAYLLSKLTKDEVAGNIIINYCRKQHGVDIQRN